jgi:hypothetical protein
VASIIKYVLKCINIQRVVLGVILIGLSDVVVDGGFISLVFKGCEICCISVV